MSRALANALGAGGSGIGGLVYAFGSDTMIAHIGPAWAFFLIIGYAISVFSSIPAYGEQVGFSASRSSLAAAIFNCALCWPDRIYSLFGVFPGVFWCTAASVGAEVVGIQLLPAALSITWLSLVVPATFAEAIGLSLRKDGINAHIDV